MFLNEGSASANAGKLLIFSAGTFLYVATVHVFSEIQGKHSHSVEKERNELPSPATEKNQIAISSEGMSIAQIVCILVGLFSPLLIDVGHHK